MSRYENKFDIEVDKLTNSIENAVTGDSFDTEICLITDADLRSLKKGNGWQFDWKYEYQKEDRKVYKLIVKDNVTIQGLISLSDFEDHIYIQLIESAPFNKGKRKVYVGIPGNLVAFACKESWDKGYEGFVAFQSKTKLIAHYESTLGAVHIGGHKMVIFPKEALRLIKQYFKTN